MSTIYDQAPKAMGAMLNKVFNKHHRDLVAAGVTLDLLVACRETADGEEPEPVFTHGEVTKTRKTSLMDRAAGRPDASIIIDRVFGWDRLSEARREAVLFRALQKLELCFDQNGELKRDDHRRPKLKIRPYDWEHSGFESELELYGEASVASAQLTRFMDAHNQWALFAMPGTEEVKIEPKLN